MKQSDEKQLAEAAKKLLDQRSDQVSMRVSMRLKQARMAAVNVAQTQVSSQLSTGNMSLNIPDWLGAISTTTIFGGAILIAALLWINPLSTPQKEVQMLEDMQLLSSEEEIDLYQNLDFYLWLSDENTAP